MSTYGTQNNEPSGYPGQPGFGQQPGGTYYGQQPQGAPQPPYGTPPPGWGYQPVKPKSQTLGLVGFIMLVVAIIVGTVWTAFAYPEMKAWQDAGQPESGMTGSLVAFALACIILWLVGVASFIIGIVATSTGRGRVWGILAIVLSLAAPFISLWIGALASGVRP